MLAELVAVVESHAAYFALKFEGLKQLGLGYDVGPIKIRIGDLLTKGLKVTEGGGSAVGLCLLTNEVTYREAKLLIERVKRLVETRQEGRGGGGACCGSLLWAGPALGELSGNQGALGHTLRGVRMEGGGILWLNELRSFFLKRANLLLLALALA